MCYRYTAKYSQPAKILVLIATSTNSDMSAHLWGGRADPEVIKLFPCSTQLSTKFQLLIKNKIPTNEEVSYFKSLSLIFFEKNILFTKSRGYSNIINHSIYQTNAINLKQLVLISQVI